MSEVIKPHRGENAFLRGAVIFMLFLYYSRLFFTFFSADAIYVAFKIAVVYKPGENILLKTRYGTGIKPKLFVKERNKLFRQHHIPDAHRRRHGF